jgi:hypothetical protein
LEIPFTVNHRERSRAIINNRAEQPPILEQINPPRKEKKGPAKMTGPLPGSVLRKSPLAAQLGAFASGSFFSPKAVRTADPNHCAFE